MEQSMLCILMHGVFLIRGLFFTHGDLLWVGQTDRKKMKKDLAGDRKLDGRPPKPGGQNL